MEQQIFRQQPQGLYDPRQEHDACGVGMVADLNGRASHDIVKKGITILCRLMHRGAAGSDPEHFISTKPGLLHLISLLCRQLPLKVKP